MSLCQRYITKDTAHFISQKIRQKIYHKNTAHFRHAPLRQM